MAAIYSAYRTYEVKRQVAEGIAIGNELISPVTEFFRRQGEVPSADTLNVANLPFSSAIVQSVTVVDGRIDIRYGDDADPALVGRQISLTPFETVERSVVWVCGNKLPGAGVKPLGFASGGRRAIQIPTTIEARYLSQHCR